ncbi:MAG: OmpA family protein [Bacteroidetes bacterium]|nr:OmpA family protein [Bacteroidota bacterium]
MFFTACDRPGSLGSCDIYFSAFSEGKWTQPFNLNSPVNTGFWESQPSVSADGKVLFFSSSRAGGIGGKDIWYSVLDTNSRWGYSINMGKEINSEGDEMSPFIHFDGRTLYFSSDGRAGMGGFDLYMTRMDRDSVWSEPENLGYPINTFNDEMGLVIESNGKRAYFSSIREKAKGKDIYYFDLDESKRPDPVSYLKGKVIDKETGAMIKAEYELINLSTNQVTVKNSTDSRGAFLVCLPSGYNYGINVSKPGYLFHSENFLFEGVHTVTEPFIKKIILSPIKIGAKMLLANVFYATDSWEIMEESSSELNNLAYLLSENRNMIMEIGGHTDSTGSDEHNMVLSEKRALSVVTYLIKKGIQKERLKYKGYGNSLPVGDNNTEEGRQLNRRTEAKILDIKK